MENASSLCQGHGDCASICPINLWSWHSDGLPCIDPITYTFTILELQKLNGSKLIRDMQQTVKLKSGATVMWLWRLECGVCHKTLMLRYDADLKGRINAFQRRK